jgi:hypothetical protein
MSDSDTSTAISSGDEFYPAALKDRPWWVNWVLAVRYDEIEDGEPVADAIPTKQPVDPENRGDAAPCKWHAGLDDEKHPTTRYEVVERWNGTDVGLDVQAPERVLSDTLSIGIIIPPAQNRNGDAITLIDWDDVRDPETGEIHPTCAWALEELDTYAEISQSGEGIHQFVFGDIPGDHRKYLRHVDDEPFVGDDRPMFEMYSSGRLTAMTGEHVAGSGTDVVAGQQLIDELCYRFRNESNNATPTPTHPFGDGVDSTTEPLPESEAIDEIVNSDVAYDGEDPDNWDAGTEHIRYHAVLRGRKRKANEELPSVANWKLIRYAALLGKEAGFSKERVLGDLITANDWDGAKRRCKRQINSAWRAHENDRLHPPSVQKLKSKGLLPKGYADQDATGNDEMHGAVPRGALEARDGVYGKLVPNYSDDDREFDWETVTTFQLETIERLQTDDGERLTLRVYPAHPSEDSYEVDVHPTVFNEQRTFKEEVVRGRTTSFNGGQEDLNALRKTVGVQDAPTRIASEHIGLAGDHYDEWVAPNGTLTADDADEMPTYRYHTKGGSSDTDGSALARKWQLEAESIGEYEAEEAAKVAELLPQTRKPDRGIPILGWFYAAPLRPLIHDWADEFNLLQVIGSTGTGKTSTLKTYWEAFGMQPDPFSASDTTFTLTKHMSSSCGVPVWIDEYKPADIDDRRLDKLHRRLREVTKGTAVSKGRPDLGEVVFRLEAPVVVSGEQKFNRSIPAVRRRSIMTSLSATATEEGSVYQRAFAQLTGTAYTDASGDVRYPDGYDLEEHARAYYSFILNEDAEKLKEVWKSCKERTADILSDRGYTLDQTEFRGLQTVLFGIRLHSKFATEHGVDPQKLPSTTEIGDAFEHLASNIGKQGKRRGYDDIFLELFSQAASAGYLEQNVDFKFYTSSKHGDEVLSLHMLSAYADVKRYVRGYNLSDEYNIIGKSDYVSALADKSGNDSHILAVNHVVRLNGGRAKCAVIHPKRTQERLGSDFDLRAYQQDAVTDEETSHAEEGGERDATTKDGSESEDTPAYTSAGELEAPTTIQDREKVPAVRGTIMAIWENRYGQPVTELHDEDGSIDIHIQGFDSPALTPLSEGGEYELEGLRYRDPDDERAYYEMRPTTGIERLDAPDADDDADDDAGGDESGTQSTTETVTTDSPDSQSQTVTSNQTATDGGESDTDNHQQTDTTEPTDAREQLATAFNAAVEDSTGLADKMALQRALTEYCDDMQAAKELIDRATMEGWLSEPVSHRYRCESLPEVRR